MQCGVHVVWCACGPDLQSAVWSTRGADVINVVSGMCSVEHWRMCLSCSVVCMWYSCVDEGLMHLVSSAVWCACSVVCMRCVIYTWCRCDQCGVWHVQCGALTHVV